MLLFNVGARFVLVFKFIFIEYINLVSIIIKSNNIIFSQRVPCRDSPFLLSKVFQLELRLLTSRLQDGFVTSSAC